MTDAERLLLLEIARYVAGDLEDDGYPQLAAPIRKLIEQVQREAGVEPP